MRLQWLIPVLTGMLCLPTFAAAQVNTATGNGLVSDESESALPAATVTTTDLDTDCKDVAVERTAEMPRVELHLRTC